MAANKDVPAKPETRLVYGTAGFRTKAELLDSTCFRIGVLAVLRAIKQGKPVGIMVTASHNAVADNGMKIADSSGGMLAETWEKHCTALANAEDLREALDAIVEEEGLKDELLDPEVCKVFIGRDTRPTSSALKQLCVLGVEALGGTAFDIGVVTTPQLHHVVYCYNRKDERHWASVKGYYAKLSEGYAQIVGTANADGPLYVDCANGVGALHLLPFNDKLQSQLEFKLFNADVDHSEKLNVESGAEWVQKGRVPPTHLPEELPPGARLASFDGDADRVVFYYFELENGGFQLLDGDKIAVLVADFVAELLAEAQLEFNLGIVQTAYANGAAHDYVQAKGIECPYAKTGVKYCHAVADQFEIGIYFEANGHGTAIMKDSVVAKLSAVHEDCGAITPESPDDLVKKERALRQLLGCAKLLNQAVGDSTADAMFVEAVLAVRGWTVQQWATMYQDKPSRQTKVGVKDRRVVVPIPDETRLDPDGSKVSKNIQEAIDAACAAARGRAFCRPSGTEDVVRVYAEAGTEDEADQLANQVATIVFEMADGQGAKPELGKWK